MFFISIFHIKKYKRCILLSEVVYYFEISSLLFLHLDVNDQLFNFNLQFNSLFIYLVPGRKLTIFTMK